MAGKDLSDMIRRSLNGKEPEKKHTVFREILSWALVIVLSIGAAMFLNRFIIVNARVTSGSMEHTIMTKDRVLGLRFVYWFSEPKRGDIIIFKYPDNEEEIYIKRVIGVPGDIVEIVDGQVYINSEPLDEPYLWEKPYGSFGPYEVPEGRYFMLGDNRNNSRDSRSWINKYVSKDQILGKAYWVYYPTLKSVG